MITGTAGSAAGIAFVGRTDVQPAGIAAIQSTTGGGNTSLSFMYVGSNTTTEGMRLDTSCNLGIGTASPAYKLDVAESGAPTSTNTFSVARISGSDSVANDLTLLGPNTSQIRIKFGDPESATIGEVGYNHSTNSLRFVTNGAMAGVFDSSVNLGLGVTPSAWAVLTSALQVKQSSLVSESNDQLYLSANAFFDGSWKYIASDIASQYYQAAGAHVWRTAPSGTAGNTISFTQAMTLDASGNLGIGTTSPGVKLDVQSSASLARFRNNTSSATTSYITVVNANNSSNGLVMAHINDGTGYFGTQNNAALRFVTNDTERARITSGGDLLVGTTNTNPVGADINGFAVVAGGRTSISRLGGEVLGINRGTDYGTLVSFAQAGSTEGSISVSGGTVSYNAFAGSHWSQLQDGSKPDILRGTVMESINELCVWPDEQNERLPKSKVSDTAGSKKVYGVFMAWDNDWATTNDMYVTAVGAFICRVNASVTVQEGDLLESNGDGTARVQADDIIRSSTIGKVTSTVKTHQYADGSYCVPTVLYCG